MPVIGFKAGDFVEYDSTNSRAVLRGIVHCIGYIGEAPKQPRHVAFVSDNTGRTPLLVGVSRLRPGERFATWAEGSCGVA